MPISGPASYVIVTEEFLNHWEQVNAALPPLTPFTLPGTPVGSAVPYTRAMLSAQFTALQAQHFTVGSKINETEIARADLEILKDAIRERLVTFNDTVRARFGTEKWVRALPAAPSSSDARSKFMDPMDDAANLWSRINVATGTPVNLRGNTDLGDFEDQIVAVRGAYSALQKSEQGLRLEREERNDMQETIDPVLKQYRLSLPTVLDPAGALVQTMPVLSPGGGHTPDAVAATGVWDVAQSQAKLTWAASADAALDHYQVRTSPGPVYSTNEETVVGTVQPGDPRELLTVAGLAVPGAVARFRVYVVLTSGRERGSETVSVARP